MVTYPAGQVLYFDDVEVGQRYSRGRGVAAEGEASLRPAVIVSDDRLHHPNLRMVIVVPGTSTIRRIPLHVSLPPDSSNGLTTETAFQVEQVRAVSTGRLVERLGRLDALGRHAIDEILRNALGL